MPKRNER